MDRLQPGVSEVLIVARTPRLSDVTVAALEQAWHGSHHELGAVIVQVSRVLAEMGIIAQPILGAFETPRGVAGARERTEAEFGSLLLNAGFGSLEVKRLAAPRDVILAHKN